MVVVPVSRSGYVGFADSRCPNAWDINRPTGEGEQSYI